MSTDQTPTLDDDTFIDQAIASCSLTLWHRKDGGMTNVGVNRRA